MRSALDANALIFEHPDHWNGTTSEDPLHQERNRLLVGLIPHDVQTLLDVGCGEGAFAQAAAAAGVRVHATDRSRAALRRAGLRGTLSDITGLPFRDHSYDLVSCIEVIEHLDGRSLAQAVAELARVSKRYLLISVPYREQRVNQSAKCGSCGCVFHAWGHRRSFRSLRQVRRLFPGWQPVATAGLGSQSVYILPGLAWLRLRLLGRWMWERSTLCPNCQGSRVETAAVRSTAVTKLLEGVEWRLARERHPWWMMVTLRRRGGGI